MTIEICEHETKQFNQISFETRSSIERTYDDNKHEKEKAKQIIILIFPDSLNEDFANY